MDDQDVQTVRSLPVCGESTISRVRPLFETVTDRPTAASFLRVLRSVQDDVKRQAADLSIHVPGEIPDLQSLHLQVLDHDLMTLTECTLGFISHVSLREITRRRPNVAEVFWRDTLIDAAMFREWIVNVGQRRPQTGLLILSSNSESA